MENPDISDRLYEDTPAGALARREVLLRMKDFSPWENLQIQAYMAGIPTTQERAIDKITALTLFRQQYPDRQSLAATLANTTDTIILWYRRKTLTLLKSATAPPEEVGDLTEVIVHRLPSGNWLEKGNGHAIPPCFPWAQILEAELKARKEQAVDQNAQQEGIVAAGTTSFAKVAAKVLGKAG